MKKYHRMRKYRRHSEELFNAMMALEDLILAVEAILTCDERDERGPRIELDRKTCIAKALWIGSDVPFEDPLLEDQRRALLLRSAREYWTWRRANDPNDEEAKVSSLMVDLPECELRLIHDDQERQRLIALIEARAHDRRGEMLLSPGEVNMLAAELRRLKGGAA